MVIATGSGSLDRANDRVTDGGRTGDVDATHELITLDAGGTVAITDGAIDYVAVISGNTFSGGTADLSSTQITTDLTGAELVDTSGGFYGPGADEVGGVVLIDDTGTGSLLLLGDFVAD